MAAKEKRVLAMIFNIATYNIQHCKSYVHFKETGEEILSPERVSEVIRELGADICALNEVYNQKMLDGGSDQAEKIADGLGYYHFFAKAIDYKGFEYGNALVSKFPIKAVKTVPIIVPENERKKPHYENRVLLVAELDIEGKPFTVAVCHFGLSDEEKELAVSTVLSELGDIKTPLIFMGDLNLSPDTELISKLQSELCDLSKQFGKEDPTFDSLAPYTKIDYIFAKGSLKAIDCEVVYAVFSDHLPVRATIEI